MRNFGRFEVVAQISRGGMADVYRCRLRGMGGFEKTVVVKRIRADRAQDPVFVGMFLDEARLCAQLDHPNIVQVYEIGEAEGAPYIAMEYVAGPTLAALARQLAAEPQHRHLGHLARIMADVCAGLHEAHTARAADGQLLGIVHRDVSPQNIVVSRQGLAKLLDFGVAKAHGRLTETRAGSLKGKLRYMAPERLDGVVDARADVFAAGVCLFEAAVGRSPFGAEDEDEIALFKRIASGRYARPAELAPGFPPALERIILQAIEPDPTRRCPTARQLHDQLEAFVGSGPHHSNSRAVAAWVTALSGEPDIATGEGPTPAPPSPPGLSTGSMPSETPAMPADAARSPRRRLRFPIALAALAAAAAVLYTRPAGDDAWSPLLLPVPSPRVSPASSTPPSPSPPMIDWDPPTPPPSSRQPPRRRHPARTGSPPPPTPVPVATPAKPAPAPIHSTRPLAMVPRPRLPRVARLNAPAEARHILAAIEFETLRAGCSPAFALGITERLRQALLEQGAAEIYPSAIYYFIVREAGLGREKSAAAAALTEAHVSGAVKVLAGLPLGSD